MIKFYSLQNYIKYSNMHVLMIQRRKMMQKILGKISNVHKLPIFDKYINYKTFWWPYKKINIKKIRPVKTIINLKKTNRKQVALETLSLLTERDPLQCPHTLYLLFLINQSSSIQFVIHYLFSAKLYAHFMAGDMAALLKP